MTVPTHTTPVDAEQAGWKFSQCFGDKAEVDEITEADIISAVEFNHDGDYLATGDKGGRVVLFKRCETKKGYEYRFFTEFQSHEPEFDYLKSLEIEEKINKIRWCKRQNNAHFLLSTNDKTIKLWKVYEKTIRTVAENNGSAIVQPYTAPPSFPASGFATGRKRSSPSVDLTGVPYFRLPRLEYLDTYVASIPKKVYANAHGYHINSISINSDGETYLSADDLRINLWNLDRSDQSFNMVDVKPANMEELQEVITSAEFHPQSCNLFCYSSSKGVIRMADMREHALCDKHSKVFYEMDDEGAARPFFTEILSSISDLKFSHDGRYIVTRDFLTVKVWDVNMEREPVKTIEVYEPMRNKLCDAYETDSIFDKFESSWSGDGRHVLAGSYNNYFHIYDVEEDTDVALVADKAFFRGKKNKKDAKPPTTMHPKAAVGGKPPQTAEDLGFGKKILHASWHPTEGTIAIGATNNLFMYYQQRPNTPYTLANISKTNSNNNMAVEP